MPCKGDGISPILRLRIYWNNGEITCQGLWKAACQIRVWTLCNTNTWCLPKHHTNKQNEDPTPEKAKTWKSEGAAEKSRSPRSSRHRALVETEQLPAFYTNNIELIWAGLWVGRKADTGEIPEAFLETMGKEKAGGVALTLTDPEEDSRNWEPRESPGNDSQLRRALLRKWLPLGATN